MWMNAQPTPLNRNRAARAGGSLVRAGGHSPHDHDSQSYSYAATGKP